ncbi:SRPBCC family protein [Puniceibacterium sp. IMCC21224]|uniref:SRPBCC family protein n=1 Tax=Puniceibacterium sp. IMCC21224 TaxID=1618204 RepID=UPI00064DE9D8|nr:SRPBCC family protein [Puniceibacterium sp. IMCC21224]KMK68152.1 Polyketide cyclase / dehydrase and lipid transport [Puniceibacterium sp. IMCC21224]
MEFTTKEDIEAPLDQVYAAVSDFDSVERSVRNRGIDVRRASDADPVCVGTKWVAGFRFRGKMRDATVTLAQLDPPQMMQFRTVSGGLETETRLELVSLSRTRTRISVAVEMQPKTLSARLLVQSMRLAKSNITKRFRVRAADYARDLELRLKSDGKG